MFRLSILFHQATIEKDQCGCHYVIIGIGYTKLMRQALFDFLDSPRIKLTTTKRKPDADSDLRYKVRKNGFLR